MAKSSASSRSPRPTEVDRADREPTATTAAPAGRGAARTPRRPATEGPRATASQSTNAAPAAQAPRAGAKSDASVADKSAPRPIVSTSAPKNLQAAEAVRMERASIGLTNEQRAGVSGILNRALSDEHVLYIRTRNYHWNVTGMHFKSLHEFFEEQYKQIEIAIDEIAERARSMGFRAIGSMTEFIAHTHLKEQNPAEVPDATGMLRNLLNDHESIIKQLREDIDTCDDQFKDAGTADFLTEKLEEHEKMAWMIRAYLA
jgi:starvation-inducible DNA-binding protein